MERHKPGPEPAVSQTRKSLEHIRQHSPDSADHRGRSIGEKSDQKQSDDEQAGSGHIQYCQSNNEVLPSFLKKATADYFIAMGNHVD